MKPAYFVVRMFFGHDGEVIKGSDEIVSVLTNEDTIREAEADFALRKSNGEHSREDLLKEAKTERKRKSDRPTVPEMPAVRIQPWPRATS